jgi:type III secretion protein U
MSDKTEEASPKRLQDARDRGNVPQSREAVSTAAMAAGLAALGAAASAIEEGFRRGLSVAIASARAPSGAPSPVSPWAALARAADDGLVPLALCLGAAAGTAALVGALLAGFLFTPRAAVPSLERLDPGQLLARLAKPRTYVEPVISLAKAGVLAALAWSSARGLVPLWRQAPSRGVAGISAIADATLRRPLAIVLAAAAAFAALDVLYRRWQHARDLRMSRDELQREHKESEGDPHARHARERLHKELLSEATLHNVRKARFVVTNPTHYAVALGWDEETMEAPQLLAKGEGELARRIIAEAHAQGIPVLRDAPLARSLHASEIGEEIPEALYEGVAAIVRFLTDGGDADQYAPDAEPSLAVQSAPVK